MTLNNAALLDWMLTLGVVVPHIQEPKEDGVCTVSFVFQLGSTRKAILWAGASTREGVFFFSFASFALFLGCAGVCADGICLYRLRRISVRVGSSFHDLQELEAVDLNEPTGWVHIATRDSAGNPVRTFFVQIAVLSNHQNGRDTHLRQIKVHSPVQQANVSSMPKVNFTSVGCRSFSCIR